jgi:hypothetical protein
MTPDFISVDKDKEAVTVKVNAAVFPIDLVYNAAYRVLERAYVILDGSPGETIYVIMRPRKFKGDLMELGRVFYDELIASAFQAVQFVRNREMREALMRSLSYEGEPETRDEDYDEKDIAKLWEDKFGGGDEGSGEAGE